MKKISLFLILVISTFTAFAQQKIAFNVRYSELYATYDFLIKLSNNYPDNDLKTIFAQSKYNTEILKKQISTFEQLKLNYTYSFDQYPLPLKAGLMSIDLLERNLALSETITDFKSKSVGLIPSEDLTLFSSILEDFRPIYRTLIFEPNKVAFEVQRNNLLNYVNSNKFANYFQVGLAFYNTNWDKDIPFELCLLPSLEKNNLGARAFFNVAICEASFDLKDHLTFFSVAMHEIYHIVYDNQSLAMKSDVQKWFNNTKSNNSQYALLLMNEVLATALGNGYIMEQLAGKIEEADWYNNKYITAMAKEIYPVVKNYIEAKKPMDEAFIKTYVGIYDSKFKQWNKELNHLMAYRYILANNPDDLRYFRKTYRKYSYNRMGAPITLSDIEKMKNVPITKVFVVSEQHQQTLNLIESNFAELKNQNMDYKSEFIKVLDLNDHTKIFIINRHQSSIEALMNTYFPNKTIQ